jgi:hypothetical protein
MVVLALELDMQLISVVCLNKPTRLFDVFAVLAKAMMLSRQENIFSS